MSRAYQEFLNRLKEIESLHGIMGLVSWDDETFMPKGAVHLRAEQKAVLTGIAHEKLTAPELGELAKAAQAELEKSAQMDEVTTANFREFFRAYNRAVRVPKDLAQALEVAETKSHQAWIEARSRNRFVDFLPHFQEILRLRQHESQAIDDKKNPYDIQMDRFEPDLTAEMVKKIFQELKPGLINLLKAIQASPIKPKTTVLQGKFDPALQEKFACEVATTMGFDFNRGRMDVSVHPFCGGSSMDDIRITTRFIPDDLTVSLFAVIHEAGHALYEQGLHRAYLYQPIGASRSMGVHESQSLFWEKRIALSHPFWEFYYPKLQKTFSPHFDRITFADFYQAIHEVRPSLIRVDADEVTYPLHVILRFELEEALFAGQLDPRELPEAWNQKMQEYLGITPPTEREGVLQDVHWSLGLFGYFPAYNLGAIYASQIFSAAQRHVKNLDDQIRGGNFADLKGWLNREIHERGKLYSTPDLIRRVTGETINPTHHVELLRQKYGEIYQI